MDIGIKLDMNHRSYSMICVQVLIDYGRAFEIEVLSR